MKEMMKQRMMNRFHKRNSSTSSSIDFKSGEKLDFKFSSLQALQVPAGWDKLTLSLIAVETDKTVTKTGKASVWNGNCRWTESLLESIWVSPDDSSKEVSQYLYKLLISKASTRSGILGEVTVNLSNYLSSENCLPVALPLQKCDHGTILQVAIQCLTPRTNLRWSNSKTNSITEDVNSDLSDLDNVSDAPNGTNITNLGSSVSNSILDTSRARGPGSRGTSSSSVRSHHSFDSMDDSFGRESSHSNLSENAIDAINNKPESSTSTNVYDSPRSNRSPYGSGKNLLNKKQDSGKMSHTVPLSPLRTFKSSEFILESEGTTPEELRAEARTWERNARKLKVDLDLSRNETINQTKNLENATLQLSALQKECDGLKDEIKHLKIRLGESEGKERDADNLKIQVKDKNNLQVELEDEIRFQKDLNYNLSLQLNKTQDSNLELVSILQELEETIEKQKLEIENLTASEPARESNDSWQYQESQKLESTILYLEKTLEEKTQTLLDSESEWKKKLKSKDDEIFNLEKTLEEKSQTLLDSESEWKKKLKSKDDEIFNLEAKLSEAAPFLKETEFQTIETSDLVEELKEKILELEKDCNELTDENLQLIFKLKESSKHLSASDDFINSSPGEQPSTESTGFEESKKMNSGEIDFENKCMDLESEVERYRVKEKEQENEIAELNRLLKSRLEEQQTSSFNQEDLGNLIMELESKVEDLHEELLTKTSEIEDLKSNCLLKEEEIQSQNHSKKDFDSRISDLQIVNSQLGDSLILMQKEVNDTKNSHISEIKILEKKLLELESHNHELEQKSSQNSESEIMKFKTEIGRLENEVQDMKNRWLESQQECEFLKKENPELESTTENVMEEYSQLQKSNRELRSQRLELNNRCTFLEAKLRDSEDNLLKFSKNFENLEERLSLMLDEIASKEGIFNSEIDGLDLQFKEHMEKCVDGENLLNKLYSEKVADKDKMVNLISELEEKVKLSEEKLETIEIDYEKLMELLENTRPNEEKLKNTVGEMSANLKSCEYKVIQLTEEKSNLELQVQKLQDEIVSLENSLNDLKCENERLEASLQEKVTNMQKAVVELEDYKRNKTVLEEKILRLQEQNKDLKTDENEDTKLTEDAEVDESSRMKSLEMALAEALESNEMYKGQLKSFLAEEQSKNTRVELEMKKEEKLEAELNELQERYLNMSLKYAEVEAQREELVLKLKAVGPARGWFS